MQLKINAGEHNKHIIDKGSKDNQKFFPYKTQNFRWNEYRRNKMNLMKKLTEPKINQTQQSQTKQISIQQKVQKNNPQQLKEIIVKDMAFKSPLIFKKNQNINNNQKTVNDIKMTSPILQQIPLVIETDNKSPEFKLHSLKQVSESVPKQNQPMFRKTFCTSLNKNYKNRSLQMKVHQRRPPTSNLQTFRPATRIRKVSNIGQESNSNFLAKYEIIKQLGKGTYGTVYLAKVIKKQSQNLMNTTTYYNFSLSKKSIITNQANNTLSNQKLGPEEYFSAITQNESIVNTNQQQSLLLPKIVGSEQNPANLETINQIEDQKQIPITRDDHQIQIKDENKQTNNSLKQNLTKQQQKTETKKQEPQINQDDELVAIKVYQKFKMNKDPAKFKNIRKQITIMQNLNHQGVIKLYESVQSITKISLVVQFGGQMSLLDYLKKNYPLKESKIKDFSKQLLQIIIYLHQKNIVHRDIKPQNILVKINQNTHQETLKLIDYGFSTLTNKSRKLNVICGTPNFMAPELLSSKQYFGQKADVWSYGVVTFVMAEGRHPFKSNQYQQLARLVNKGKYIFKKKHEPLFEQFIGQILKINSDQRPTAVQVSKLKWLQQQ